MTGILRKYQRKILAVVVIFLMIVFIVDIGLRRDNTQDTTTVIAHIGEDPIRAIDYQQARAEWEVLNGRDFANFIQGTLARKLMDKMVLQQGDFMAQFTAFRTAQETVSRLDETTYMLLAREAGRLGIQVNRDTAEQVRAELAQRPHPDPQTRERAILNWLGILETFDRVSSFVKVSPAMAMYEVAQSEQQVALQLVEFRASALKDQVPAPTPEQLQAFFQKYRDVDPQTDEFGIGYRFPDRVKLEYVKVPRADVAKTVTDEDIYKYWKDNQVQFIRPATQPAEPTTQPLGPEGPPATLPATTQAVASTQPTTRPWSDPDVKQEIRNTLAAQRAQAMVTAMTQTFRADYPAYRDAIRAAAGATQPATSAQTSLGVPYNSYVYLQRLQSKVQNLKDSRGVLPVLYSEPNFLSRQDLENLPGIGKSVASAGQRTINFADFATQNAEALLTPEQVRRVNEAGLLTLALYQSSPYFRDNDGNLYVFRLTGADKSHAAESIGVVESRIREDYVSLQAYELARQAARKFLEVTKTQGFPASQPASQPVAATQPAGRNVITTELFGNDRTLQTLKSYALSPQATRKLVEGGFDLLEERLRTGDEHPVGVIDLPRAFTSVVSRLHEATPATKDAFFPVMVQQTRQMIEGQRVQQMMLGWFSPDAVETRLGFKSEELRDRPRPRRADPTPIFPGM